MTYTAAALERCRISSTRIFCFTRSAGTPRMPSNVSEPSRYWIKTMVRLSVQVLQEFYVQATRPTRPHPLAHETAVGLVSAWTRFKVQEITLSILTGALEIKAAHGFSYWDSAIIAAARALGCRILYSEDMSHGQEVERVVIVNPFR